MNVNGLLDGDQHVQEDKQVNNNNNTPATTASSYPPSPPLTAHGSEPVAHQSQPHAEVPKTEVAAPHSYPSPPLTHDGVPASPPSGGATASEPTAAQEPPPETEQQQQATSVPADIISSQPPAATPDAPPARDESVAAAPADSPRQTVASAPQPIVAASQEVEVASSTSQTPAAEVLDQPSDSPQRAPSQPAAEPAGEPVAVATAPVIESAPAQEVMPPNVGASGQKRSAEPEENPDAPNKRVKSSTPPAPDSQPMVLDQPPASSAPELPAATSHEQEGVSVQPSLNGDVQSQEVAQSAATADMDEDAPGSAELPPQQTESLQEVQADDAATLSSAPDTAAQPPPAVLTSEPPAVTAEPAPHSEPSHIAAAAEPSEPQSQPPPQQVNGPSSEPLSTPALPSVDTVPFAPSFSSSSTAPMPAPSASPDQPNLTQQSSFSEAPGQDTPSALPFSSTFQQQQQLPPPAFEQQNMTASQEAQPAPENALPYDETPFSQAAAALQRGETLEFAPKPDTSWVKAEKPLAGGQFKFAQRLIKDLLKHKAAGPFHMPVDPYSLNLPTYWSVIKRPIDFGSISNKLNNGAYGSLDDFAADVRRVFSNCYHFNGEAAPVSLMAKQVEPVFEAKIRKAPPVNAPVSGAGAGASSGGAGSAGGTKQRKNSITPVNTSASRQGGAADRPKREVQPPTPFDGFDEASTVHHPPPPKKKSVKTPTTNMLPEELKFCKEVLRELNKKTYQPFAWPFLQPVDWQGLGLKDYPEIVPRPMDLGTMKQKIDAGQYYDADSFYRDFKLCISNCVKYNGSESDVGKMASQLDAVFNSKWAEKPALSDDDNSDDGEIRMMEQQLEMMRENLDRMKENKARKRAERMSAKLAARAAEKAASAAAARKAKPPPAPRPAPKQARRPSPELDVAFEEEPDDDFDFDAELADTAKRDKPAGRGGGGGRRKSHKKRRDSDEEDFLNGAGGGGAVESSSRVNKAADDHSRSEEITFEMKQELANGIGALDADKLDKAIDIIRKSRPDLLGDESKEIELDIDSLDNSTLYKLYTFVVRGGNKNKPKRQETLTARGHRAQKGGRAGTGGLKGKSLDEAAESAKIKALEAQLAQFTAENGGSMDASASMAAVAAAAGGQGDDDEEESESEDEGGNSTGSEE